MKRAPVHLEDREIGLDARDPDYIRSMLPLMWMLSSLYFRAEVRGFERVPRDGPVLFVGNHSGGNVTPDTTVFLLAFNAHFGVERPLYALAHSLVTSWPVIGKWLERWGALTASPTAARRALESGASVLVYPGGDVEVHRPFRARYRVDFAGRTGFIRLARDARVPIVPVVSCGGHNTYLPLTDGRKIAKALRLNEIARLEVLPISLALPWGLDVGDFFGHVPLPAKIVIEILEPIDVVSRFPHEEDTRRAYDYVTLRMQEALVGLSAERLLAV
ncbi:MAG TPA: lysophospholipid acyltransferase family protein [Polyangiaceae bacterium]|nr:lysophospholipid acyltransferase family protein [Polyangiaceae bacterium]